MTPKLEELLKKYLQQDRQWPRACRIAHARSMLMFSDRPVERKFWSEVLKANGVDLRNRGLRQSRSEIVASPA